MNGVKITKVEIVRSKEPIPLPEAWMSAWRGPKAAPVTSFDFAFYRVHTDAGVVGLGPYTGANPALVQGIDPFQVGEFWDAHMSGCWFENQNKRAAGLEVALWDIIGKAVNQPVHRLLGARRDRVLAYAATSRLLPKEQMADLVQRIMGDGFRAVKLRLHRPDPRDDLAVVEAVRKAAGDDLIIVVDANQNHVSEGYKHWSRRTALQMARELDALGVYFLEEPLPMNDVEGLAEIARTVDMFVAGGEHAPTVYTLKEHLLQGAYDIVQPDVTLSGNLGITGLCRLAMVAGYLGRQVVPHVSSGAGFPLAMAATLQAMGTADNCPMIEFPYDPPILTTATMQVIARDPIWIDEEGCVRVPDKPGIGIELDEEKLANRVVVS